MKLHFSYRVLKLTGLIFLAPLMLSAQISSTVWLTIRDDAGGHDSLVFGNDTRATYCIDTALGEHIGWPETVGFTAVFEGPDCFTNHGIAKKDIHPFKSNVAAGPDTFDILFFNSDSAANYTIVSATLRWPSKEYLSQEGCDSMFMVGRIGSSLLPRRIDMLAQDSIKLYDVYDYAVFNPLAGFERLRIFKYTNSTVFGVGQQANTFPKTIVLQQNYPNPFNPSTSISYSIPKQTYVRLQVFNLLGQLITTLVDESKQPRTYTVTWDATTRPSGLYFYCMTAGEFVQVKKAMLVK